MFLVGCREGSPLIVPTENDVSTIKITSGNIPKPTLINEITDKQKIANILAFISANNSDWYRPLDTYPSPQLTIWFENNKGSNIFVLWLGPDWLGGEPEPKGPMMPQLRKLKENKIDEIRKLLGV